MASRIRRSSNFQVIQMFPTHGPKFGTFESKGLYEFETFWNHALFEPLFTRSDSLSKHSLPCHAAMSLYFNFPILLSWDCLSILFLYFSLFFFFFLVFTKPADSHPHQKGCAYLLDSTLYSILFSILFSNCKPFIVITALCFSSSPKQ